MCTSTRRWSWKLVESRLPPKRTLLTPALGLLRLATAPAAVAVAGAAPQLVTVTHPVAEGGGSMSQHGVGERSAASAGEGAEQTYAPQPRRPLERCQGRAYKWTSAVSGQEVVWRRRGSHAGCMLACQSCSCSPSRGTGLHQPRMPPPAARAPGREREEACWLGRVGSGLGRCRGRQGGMVRCLGG